VFFEFTYFNATLELINYFFYINKHNLFVESHNIIYIESRGHKVKFHRRLVFSIITHDNCCRVYSVKCEINSRDRNAASLYVFFTI